MNKPISPFAASGPEPRRADRAPVKNAFGVIDAAPMVLIDVGPIKALPGEPTSLPTPG